MDASIASGPFPGTVDLWPISPGWVQGGTVGFPRSTRARAGEYYENDRMSPILYTSFSH